MIVLHWRDIIRRPIITEKSNILAATGQYVFAVDTDATKNQVAEAVEKAWPNVKVEQVRIANMPAKRGRRGKRITIRKQGYKKAIVTLSEGSIDFFEGI